MKKLQLLAATAVLGATLFGAPMSAFAQNDPKDKIIPELNLDQADVRDALKILFRNVGVSYSVDPGVQGTVTVSLKNTPFETALRSILGQVNATYRIEGGIYYIVVKQEDKPIDGGSPTDSLPTTASNPIRRIKIRSADPALIFALISGDFRTDVQLQPESSTMIGGGFGGGFGGGGSGFGGGGSGFGGGGSGFGGGGSGFGGGGFGGGGFGGGGSPGMGGGGGFGRGGGGGGRGGF